jgi:hypothetical protein
MRISDADRSAAADRLSRHYGEGRLDETEFNERLDRAMRATTQPDLDALFTDLPGEPAADQPGTGKTGASGKKNAAQASPPAAALPARSSRPSSHRLISMALVVIAVIAITHALSHLLIPLVVIAVLAVLVLRYGGACRRS